MAAPCPQRMAPRWRALREAALVSFLVGCGSDASTATSTPTPTPALAVEPAAAVAPGPAVEPTAIVEPPVDPGRPTMGATRAEATPIVGTEMPAPRERGPLLVPQIVHRSAPVVALAARDRVLVMGARRYTIVERASGAVRQWGTLPEEWGAPRTVDFDPAGAHLRLLPPEYDDPEHDVLEVFSATGTSETRQVPRFGMAAFVEGGVALADVALHLYTADLSSERTIELDWTTPATRMVVAPDRRLVALENEDGDLRIVHVVRGAVVARVHAEPWPPLAALRSEEAAERARARAAEEPSDPDEELDEEPSLPEPSAHRAWVALAFSTDGRRFAAVRRDGLARVLDLSTSHLLASIEPDATAGAADVVRAGFDGDASVLVVARSDGPPSHFDASTGEPLVVPGHVDGAVDADLVSPEPFDPAPFLTTAVGGEHSIWRALAIPGMDAFLLAGRSYVTVVGPDVVREVHCIDGEAPIAFEGWPTLAIQDRGTCDVRTDEGPELLYGERPGEYADISVGDDEDDDGDYDEVEEEPEVTIVRGLLAVLGERGRRTRVPGTEGIAEDHVRIVELTGGRVLVADDGVSTRVFRVEAPLGLVATLPPGEAQYRATPAAVFSTGPTHWRALRPDDGHPLAELALDEGHAAATPTPCMSADGSTIAVGIGATLHVFDEAWREVSTLAMPASNGACVHGDRVLVQRSRGVVEVWSLSEARRTAVWAVAQDAIVDVRLGLALAYRVADRAPASRADALDVIDLDEGRVVATYDAGSLDSLEQATLSSDGRFVGWPNGVRAGVLRLRDGASIDLGLVRSGRTSHAYAVAHSGAFWAPEHSLDVLRVREAGPEGSAALLDAAATRTRFYRPTLLDDFLHDRPLPTPGVERADAAPPPE